MRKRSKYMTPWAKRANSVVRLKLRNHMALTNLTQGKATRTDMDDLIAMGNITEALYRMGFGKEHGDITQDGLGALLAVGKRGAESGRFILRAPEMAALNLLMDLHEAQMDVVTTKDMEQGLKLVDEEFRQRKMRPIVEKK